MNKEEIEKDIKHLQDLSEDVLKCEDDELIGIDAYTVGSITRVLNYIEKLENKVKELELEISLLNQTHEYDVKMIDKVKGDCVKLYEERQAVIDKLKKDINTYQAKYKDLFHELQRYACGEYQGKIHLAQKILNMLEGEKQ